MANVGNASENSCILTAVGVVGILINIALITHAGHRRVFLTTGLVICGFSQLIVAAVYMSIRELSLRVELFSVCRSFSS